MAQNFPEIGRLPNLGVKMDKNVYRYTEAPLEKGRIGISEQNISGIAGPNMPSLSWWVTLPGLGQLFGNRAHFVSNYQKFWKWLCIFLRIISKCLTWSISQWTIELAKFPVTTLGGSGGSNAKLDLCGTSQVYQASSRDGGYNLTRFVSPEPGANEL